VGEQVVHINREEELFKWAPSSYPQLETIHSAVEPYEKLFTTIQNWNTAEKRLLDATIKTINAEDTQTTVSRPTSQYLFMFYYYTCIIA